MVIQCDNVVKNLQGEDCYSSDKQKLTIKTVCVDALLTDSPDDYETKLKRARLAERLHSNSSLELDDVEVKLVKTLVANRWPPTVILSLEKAIV